MADSLEEGFKRLLLNASHHNQTNSSLLRLPGELRNRIYDCLLRDKTWLLQQRPKSKELQAALNIRLVCRQICTETAHIAFTTGTFAFHDTQRFVQWIAGLDQNRRDAIHSIELQCTLRILRLRNLSRSRSLYLEQAVSASDIATLDLSKLRSISVVIVAEMRASEVVEEVVDEMFKGYRLDDVKLMTDGLLQPFQLQWPETQKSLAYVLEDAFQKSSVFATLREDGGYDIVKRPYKGL